MVLKTGLFLFLFARLVCFVFVFAFFSLLLLKCRIQSLAGGWFSKSSPGEKCGTTQLKSPILGELHLIQLSIAYQSFIDDQIPGLGDGKNQLPLFTTLPSHPDHACVFALSHQGRANSMQVPSIAPYINSLPSSRILMSEPKC